MTDDFILQLSKFQKSAVYESETDFLSKYPYEKLEQSQAKRVPLDSALSKSSAILITLISFYHSSIIKSEV